MLCASLFPAIIGSKFPGILYLTQTLKFRQSALVRFLVPFPGTCSPITCIGPDPKLRGVTSAAVLLQSDLTHD